MTMECDTAMQNGVAGFGLHDSSNLADKDHCAVNCFDATQENTTKSNASIIKNGIERENSDTDVTASAKVAGDSSISNLENLVCDEVIIDGFSILSFNSKRDLMLYSEQSELDRRKLSTMQKEEDQSKRSRRNGSGRQKRSKLLYQQNSSDQTLIDDPNQRQGLANSSNMTSEDDTIHNTDRDRNPCSVSYGVVPFNSSCDPSHSHTVERDHEQRDDNLGKGNLTGKISPLRLSRVRKSDLTQSVADKASRYQNSETAETNHDRVGDHSHPATPDSLARSIPKQHSPSDTPCYPSSPSSAMNSARNSHLTPLAVTWNPPSLYSPTNCDEQWVHGSRPSGVDASVLESPSTTSSQPSTERPISVGGSQVPTKPTHCHQFSVAALAEETINSSKSCEIPQECRTSPNKLMTKSTSRRSTIHRSRPSARTLLHSPTPSTDDNSFSHSSLNCLPTAPRSGSTSPLPHPPQQDHHHRSFHHHSESDNGSVLSPSSVSRPASGSTRPSGSIPSCDQPGAHRAVHQRYEQPNSVYQPATQMSSPTMRTGRSTHTADSEALKTHTSSPTAPQSRIPPLPCSPSSSNISIPDPRLLQQVMGIDSNTANQLINDSRFKELYSLTMANLAATERKAATVPIASSTNVSPARTNQSGVGRNENGTPSNVVSSLNALAKMASTDLASQASMDALLRLKTMHNPGQAEPTNTRGVATNHSVPSVRHSEQNRSQHLLHSAYHDRELVNRVPLTGDSVSTTVVPPRSTSMFMSNGDPSMLPPPPPLIAGHSNDTDQAPPSANDMSAATDRSRLFYPPPPMLSSPNSFSAPREAATLSNLSVSRAARPTPQVVSPQLPDVMGGAVQAHWESFFRHMFGRPPGPTSFMGQSSHGIDPGIRPLQASGLPVLHPSPQPPPPPRPQTIQTSFPPNAMSVASSSSSRPVFPPPLPPPYSLNSMFHSQCQPVRHASGSMANALRHSPHSSASLLHRRVHPDKLCGRWADAHVRIARHIHFCQSVKSGPSTHSLRDDRLHLQQGGSFVPSHPIVRPIARCVPLTLGPRHPHAGLQSRSNITQFPPPARSWDSLIHTRPTQPMAAPTTNLVPSTSSVSGELEKSPFWNYIVNSLMANLPPELTVAGHSTPRTEAMDVFLNSIMQRLNSHGSQNNHNSMHSSTGNVSNQSSSNQSTQLFSNSTHRSGSGLQSMTAESLLHNTDHIPPSLFPPSNPILPTNSMCLSSHSGATASMLSTTNHVDGRPGLNLKRARLEPTLGHFDPTYQQPPFSLLQRLSHPSASSHQHKQDLTIQSAANLLNGYRFPSNPPSGGNAAIHAHHTLTGLNESSGTASSSSSLDKSRMKMGASAPHLAPIRPW